MERETQKMKIDNENFVLVYSAAYIIYMLNAEESIIKKNEARMAQYKDTEEDIKIRNKIEEACSADDYFKLMRKTMSGKNKELLKEKLLENEDEVTGMIKSRLLTNMTDEFVESAVNFMIKSRKDPAEWIIENYDSVRNPYARSLLCLVLGFRGGEEHVPFLAGQREAFLIDYPKETFEQGASVALCMLQGQKEYLHSLTGEE